MGKGTNKLHNGKDKRRSTLHFFTVYLKLSDFQKKKRKLPIFIVVREVDCRDIHYVYYYVLMSYKMIAFFLSLAELCRTTSVRTIKGVEIGMKLNLFFSV